MLSTGDTPGREQAWAAFLDRHSRLLLHVSRALGGDHDAAMDRYLFMLEALQRDDYHRLRAYASDGRSSFSTWLTVVARRLCLDHHRQRYGRPQADTPSAAERHRERRQLTDLVSDELGFGALEAPGKDAPDASLQRDELFRRLSEVLAALEPEDRLLLRLRFEEDVSVPAIARMLGEGAPFKLYRRLDKLLARLRHRLEQAGVRDNVP